MDKLIVNGKVIFFNLIYSYTYVFRYINVKFFSLDFNFILQIGILYVLHFNHNNLPERDE